MGLPAAGKSTIAERLAANGYARVNRDEKGGSLDSLLPVLDTLLASGTNRVVLDNTYVTRQSRAAVLGVAARHAVPVRCVWLSTSVEDAQVNAVTRIVSKYGRLLDPDEMRAMSRTDVSVFPPSYSSAINASSRRHRSRKASRGSTSCRSSGVVRGRRSGVAGRQAAGPESAGIEGQTPATARAVILWCDGVLQRSRAGHRTPMNPEDARCWTVGAPICGAMSRKDGGC